jgi:hypothetical protein
VGAAVTREQERREGEAADAHGRRERRESAERHPTSMRCAGSSRGAAHPVERFAQRQQMAAIFASCGT